MKHGISYALTQAHHIRDSDTGDYVPRHIWTLYSLQSQLALKKTRKTNKGMKRYCLNLTKSSLQMKVFHGNMRLSSSGNDGTTTAAVGLYKVIAALGQVLQTVHINMPQHNM